MNKEVNDVSLPHSKKNKNAQFDGQIQNDLIIIVIEPRVLIWFVNRIVDLKHSIWFELIGT